MTDDDFDEGLNDLESAEDFLAYFDIDYDPSIVHVNRLHILQRFHDLLEAAEDMPAGGEERRALYSNLLLRAYEDFVSSDALTEKVFRVFHRQRPRSASVDLADLTDRSAHASRV